MRGDLHPILGVPAFLLAGVASAPIFAWLRAEVFTGPADGPGLLFPYVCCAFLPAFALIAAVAMAIQTAFLRVGKRVADHAIEAAGGPPASREPLFELPFTLGPRATIFLCGAAALACIAFGSWPRGAKERQPPSSPTDATPAADPAERARALARQAVVKRLSEAGMQGMTFDVRPAVVAGRRVLRVTTHGGPIRYVVDVGEGTRLDGWGRPEPVVDVHDAAAAPVEDAEALEVEVAPVTSD